MSMRLQELHPSLVHYPIAFLPLAVGADVVAEATDNDGLREVGRIGIVLAAGSAALAAMAGLAAQEEVNAERGSEAYDMLVTHRTINLSTVLAGSLMAAWRWRERRASPAYLAAGLAALGAVGYSAYLGGKMVYKHGLGVEAAGGIRAAEHPVPEITRDNVGRAARYVARDVARGARNAMRQMRDGDVAPMLARGGRERGERGGRESTREIAREVVREPEVEGRDRHARQGATGRPSAEPRGAEARGAEARGAEARGAEARGAEAGGAGSDAPETRPEGL